MADKYFDLSTREDIQRVRVYSFFAILCSTIFYYLMMQISPSHTDFLAGRVFICFISVLCFVLTFFKFKNINVNRYSFNFLCYCYIYVYLHLLIVHDWSVFYRWSYFVVGTILCSCALRWKDYLYSTIIAVVAPIIASFYSPLNLLEAIHFHAANFTMFLVVGFSVYSHFKYKEKLIFLSRNLVESTKMTALGEMAAGMSHEINNPLTVISASAKMIKNEMDSDTPDKTKIRELSFKVERMVERIAKIIRALKDFSSDNLFDDYRMIDFAEIVDEAIELSSKKLNKSGIRLSYQRPKRKMFYRCQKNQILQVIIHLFNNAVDYCHMMPNPQIDLSLATSSDKKNLYFTIKDNGKGVEPEFSKKIMEPFFTTKELGKGIGLGLSVSLGIITAHNGELYHDPNISKSCFVIKLPLES